MASSNGGIIGVTNAPTSTTASGVWSLSAAMLAIKDSNWPLDPFAGTALRLDFNETTTLDSRITFTRATSGTFFNSSGVLSTASSGAARFDHRLEGGVWVNKGLLIEEQRTNLVQRSEEFNDAYWDKENLTITSNTVAAPDGNTTADKLAETTGNGNHRVYRNIITGTTNTNPYTWSVFAKAAERSRIVLFFVEGTTFSRSISYRANLSNGTVEVAAGNNGATLISSSIEDVGGGWYKCSVTGTLGGAQTTIWPQISVVLDNGTQSYTGTTGNGFYVWGAQLEAGAFPTSYIATTSASVTRNADVASMTSTNFSSWYNATEGTTFWQGDTVPTGQSTRAFSINDNTNNERILVSSSTSAGLGFAAAVIDNNVTQADILTPNPGVAPVANQTYKHSFAYKVNDFAASLDGSAVATDISGTIPTVDRMHLGADTNTSGSFNFLNGHIAKFYYWNTRKPDSFLETITG
jgi:hypothetical protein